MLDPQYFYFRDLLNTKLRFKHPRDLAQRKEIKRDWRQNSKKNALIDEEYQQMSTANSFSPLRKQQSLINLDEELLGGSPTNRREYA